MTQQATTKRTASAGNSNGRGRVAPAGVDAPNYDQPLPLRVVDFTDPERPKSCLEVDFPIGPINVLAQLELNSKKPIYEMGKWFAPRQPSIFRAMLIAAATEAPEDANDADRTVWEAFYANHQAAENFKGISVLDPFMGGGPTLIEGARLGFDVSGVDLNPIPWFVTKTRLSSVEPESVRSLFDDVERAVRPQVQPFTVTDCPRGHRGRWYKTDNDQCPFDLKTAHDEGWHLAQQPETFDILAVAPEKRRFYRYSGPEVIYTFWVKHGLCSREACRHRTPVLSSPVVAVKELTIPALPAECPACSLKFDWELEDARMAPGEQLVVAPGEKPFVIVPPGVTQASCPGCGAVVERPTLAQKGRGPTKKVSLTLLIHPRWLRGVAGGNDDDALGGWAGASVEADVSWLRNRREGLGFIEVRGELPPTIIDPLDGTKLINTQRGTAKYSVRLDKDTGRSIEKPDDSSFACGSCGLGQDFLTATRPTGHTPPAYPWILQGICPDCKAEKRPYSGRFFKRPDVRDLDTTAAAFTEWDENASRMFGSLVPTEPLPFAHMTHDLNGGIPNWGYTHWWKMFNPRQLLTHARLLEAIMTAPGHSQEAREAALIAFQQYLRNQNMFCFWDIGYDKLVPFFSNNNYHPKASVIENGVFSDLGRGNWETCATTVLDALRWAQAPYEKAKASAGSKANSVALPMSDTLSKSFVQTVATGSATDLAQFSDASLDLVITDPPFGGNIFYADLADFFYAWLRRPLSQWYPDYFKSTDTNKVQEAIENPAEHPDKRTPQERRVNRDAETPAQEFYRDVLTESWRESWRVLKDGGLLAFTFHHSEDQAWRGVLQSLFDAGFILVATYPIRSDESKGENAAFGSKKIEYDIIHVCRKRLEAPTRVSWAGMRRYVREEMERLRSLLQHYQQRQISEADVRVILRGKALEFYSRHYGQVYTGTVEEEPMGIAEALVGINAILDEEGMAAIDRPPDLAEPFTRQYLRVFKDRTQIPRDELHKHLRGSGINAAQFEERGWTTEEGKIVSIVGIGTRFQQLKRRRRDESLKSDLDQAHFLIGAAVPGSGASISEELSRETFVLKRSVPDILHWYSEREQDKILREAAARALSLVEAFMKEGPQARRKQLALFETD